MTAAPEEHPVVLTEAGSIRGVRTASGCMFRGIPYGDTTAGAHRFRPPRPIRWTGVRDATMLGPRAPQEPEEAEAALVDHLAWSTDSTVQGEDCLVLNVFTSELDTMAGLPVMVYVHGGAFRVGSGGAPGWDGRRLAQRGVVVVTLNHRLTVFGHLALPDSDAENVDQSANAGLLDIVAALHWVRENIGNFGGDPNNVTLFGQSGGGSKVAALMFSPPAAGLFHKAIIQSASSMLRMATMEEANQGASNLLRQLGLKRSQVNELQELPPARLLAGMRDSIRANGGVDNFRPVVDGRTLVGQPFADSTTAAVADVPLLVGWCETEQRMSYWKRPEALQIDDGEACRVLSGSLGTPPDFTRSLMEVYKEHRPTDSPGDIMALIQGDHRYRRSVTHAAERHAATGHETFLYRLSWKAPALDGLLRSPHLLCLPFVFGNLDTTRGLTGDGADRYALREQMMGAWSSFATTGVPGQDSLPRWNSYEGSERMTMILDAESRIVSDPAGEERIAVEKCPEYLPSEYEGGGRR
jgi:para-nitrobenzyl esterase